MHVRHTSCMKRGLHETGLGGRNRVCGGPGWTSGAGVDNRSRGGQPGPRHKHNARYRYVLVCAMPAGQLSLSLFYFSILVCSPWQLLVYAACAMSAGSILPGQGSVGDGSDILRKKSALVGSALPHACLRTGVDSSPVHGTRPRGERLLRCIEEPWCHLEIAGRNRGTGPKPAQSRVGRCAPGTQYLSAPMVEVYEYRFEAAPHLVHLGEHADQVHGTGRC